MRRLRQSSTNWSPPSSCLVSRRIMRAVRTKPHACKKRYYTRSPPKNSSTPQSFPPRNRTYTCSVHLPVRALALSQKEEETASATTSYREKASLCQSSQCARWWKGSSSPSHPPRSGFSFFLLSLLHWHRATATPPSPERWTEEDETDKSCVFFVCDGLLNFC